MRHFSLTIVLAMVVLLGTVTTAAAEDPGSETSWLTISASADLVSDYVWRGVSQSDEDIAAQAGFEIAAQGLYLGAWGSNVDFDGTAADDADLELDAILGYRHESAGGFGLDVGLVTYLYPGTETDLDFLEAYAGVSWRGLGLSLAYSNDVFATDTSGLYVNLGYSLALPSDFELSVAVGQYSFDEEVNGAGLPDAYIDWSAGLSWSHGAMSLGITYYGTDSDGETLFGSWAGDRVVLSLSASL